MLFSIALLLIIYSVLNVFSFTHSIYIAALPLLFALAIYLLVQYFNNSVETKSAKLFVLQKNAIDQLSADAIYAEILYWELRDVPENVLSYCYQALSIAPANYHNYFTILKLIEDTIRDIHKN